MKGVLQILRPYLRPSLRMMTERAELPAHVLNVGLTGGIGSGKSTVAQLMQSHGFAVIDLDRISHELTQAGGRAIAPIVAHFGSAAMAADGALNRAFIRERVFAEPSERAALEGILHPMIEQEVFAQARHWAQQAQCIVYDIPLLVESERWQARLDWIVVVDCESEVQLQRVQARNPQMDVTTIKAIISAQASPDQRRAIANALIDNRQNTPNRLNLSRQVDILTNYINALCAQKQCKQN